MRKIIVVSMVVILVILTILFIVHVRSDYQEANSTPIINRATPSVSNESNKAFVSSVAGSVDLNSGITAMEFLEPLYRFQINNITFVVFNHTDEAIVFSNQGFGLTVFHYDDIANAWKKLQLQHVPYPEPKILPPKLEKWDSNIDNTWDILENDSTALGYSQVRLYISGQGKNTNKTYGAYLDVTISLKP